MKNKYVAFRTFFSSSSLWFLQTKSRIEMEKHHLRFIDCFSRIFLFFFLFFFFSLVWLLILKGDNDKVGIVPVVFSASLRLFLFFFLLYLFLSYFFLRETLGSRRRHDEEEERNESLFLPLPPVSSLPRFPHVVSRFFFVLSLAIFKHGWNDASPTKWRARRTVGNIKHET